MQNVMSVRKAIKKTTLTSAKSEHNSTGFVTSSELKKKIPAKTKGKRIYAPTKTGFAGRNEKVSAVKTCWFNGFDASGKLHEETLLLTYDPTMRLWKSDDGLSAVFTDEELKLNCVFNGCAFGNYYFASKSKSLVNTFISGAASMQMATLQSMFPEGVIMSYASQHNFKRTKHKTLQA